MTEVTNTIIAIFNFLTNTQIYGIGLIWWVATPTLFGLALSLFAKKGEKDDKKGD